MQSPVKASLPTDVFPSTTSSSSPPLPPATSNAALDSSTAEMPSTSTISPTPSLSRGSSGAASDSEAKSLADGEMEVEYETDGSELSEGQDEDEDEDEEEEVDLDRPPIPQPASFYPHEHTQNIPPAPGSQWLSPDDDPSASRGIPIFHPSMDEFRDFETYMEKVAPWGHRSGIIKIVPPSEWTETLPPIPTTTMSNLRIKNPIQQNMLGRSGLFRQSTIEKKKGLTVRDWWEKCRSAPFHYPGPKDAELRKRGNPGTTSTRTSKRRKGADSTPVPSEPGTDEQEVVKQEDSMGLEDRTTAATDSGGMVSGQSVNRVTPTATGSERATSSAPSTTTELKVETIDPWYETFNPRSDWLPNETKEEDYTEEGYRNLERKFWRELGLGEACWYGADMKGSLFTDETTSWNVARLPNLLNRLNLKRKLPGVNTPYLYWGMWAAAFAWHVEDMDLYSINYIHFGAPKFWYAIPQKKADAFERHMAGYFPSDARKCDQFLRHKSFAVSPYNLGGQGSRPNIMVQKQGEFVITFPRGYHAGFNMGFNCAESINFALDDWIELGRRAKVCRCESENVHIDVDAVLEESALREAAAQAREERRIKAEQRREELKRKEKRPRRDPNKPRVPKIRIKSTIEFKPPPKPAKSVYPCILCPDQSTAYLLPVHRDSKPVVDNIVAPLVAVAGVDVAVEAVTHDRESDTQASAGLVPTVAPTSHRKRPEFAHLSCVRSTPELWIADAWDENKERSVRRVMGVESIGRERWNLKCACCADDPARQKHGSKVQCTKGKCVKAYHVTCAIKDPTVEFKEMEVDEWIVQPDLTPSSSSAQAEAGPGPTTIANASRRFSRVTVVHAHVLCPAHNPALAEKKRLEAHREMLTRLTLVPYGSPVSLRLGTGTWGSYLLSVDGEREVAMVTNDKGVPFEVKWSQIVYIPPFQVLSTTPSSPGDENGSSSNMGEARTRVRMVQDVSASGQAWQSRVGEVHMKRDAQSISAESDLPSEEAGTASNRNGIAAATDRPSTQISTTTTTTAHSLRLGSQVMLTPGLIGLLSENPLLRASLKGLGLGG